MSALDRVPLGGKIAIAVFALAMIAAVIVVIVLVSNGTIDEQIGRVFFAVFAILGGIGFITDSFKREGAPQGVLYVAFKFTSLAFTLGLIVGGWGENWWQLTIGGVVVGVIVGLIEKFISKGGYPNRAFRLVVWNLVGLAAIGEGAYIILPL